MFESDLTVILDKLIRSGGEYLDAGTRPAVPLSAVRCPHPYYPPESHLHTEIILLRSGRLLLHLNGVWTQYDSPRPKILLPGTVHTEHWTDPETEYKMFWMTVAPDGLNLHYTMFIPGRGYDQSAPRLHTASPYAQQLWQCSQSQKVDPARFHCLLLESLRYTLENGGFDSDNYHRDAVLQIKNYIDHFHQRKITLNELASLVHYTPMHLNKLFKKQFKTPIHTYLGEVRLTHAAELLRSADMKIQDVAGACGFEDQRYFSRVFKSRYGSTPQDYRRRSRNGQG